MEATQAEFSGGKREASYRGVPTSVALLPFAGTLLAAQLSTSCRKTRSLCLNNSVVHPGKGVLFCSIFVPGLHLIAGLKDSIAALQHRGSRYRQPEANSDVVSSLQRDGWY